MESREHLIELDEESLKAREGREGFQRLLDDLNRGFHARAILAEASMRAERAALEAAPLIDNGMNARPRMVVSGEAYHFWGQRLGYECWSDPEFLREFERDNPEARVNAPLAKTTILNPFGRIAREEAA